jgi:hypothetical protein
VDQLGMTIITVPMCLRPEESQGMFLSPFGVLINYNLTPNRISSTR